MLRDYKKEGIKEESALENVPEDSKVAVDGEKLALVLPPSLADTPEDIKAVVKTEMHIGK